MIKYSWADSCLLNCIVIQQRLTDYSLLVCLAPTYFFIFNLDIVALQCFISLCCPMKWISDMFRYIPTLLDLPLSCPTIPTLWVIRAPSWAPCAIRQLLTSCFTCGSVYMSILLSQFIPSSPFPIVSIRLFSISATLFLPWNFHFYWNILDLQCWVSFRHTAKWFSCTYTYVHSF